MTGRLPGGLWDGLLDDAATFPPGELPLGRAVRAHLAHELGPHGDLVGPLVVAQADLAALAELTADLPTGSLPLTVTVPAPENVALALDRAHAIGAVRLVGLEVAVPDGIAAEDVVPALDAALGGAGIPASAGIPTLPDGCNGQEAQETVGKSGPRGVGRRNSRLDEETSSSNREFHRPAGETPTVYVELPRDSRRSALIEELAGTPYVAKLRTGGVRADLHPDEAELAAAIVAMVGAGVAFKATAGLHHAVRNTDPVTGFEQHGFLNLLVATDAALRGADAEVVAGWLAERDDARLATRAGNLDPRVREAFRSFGTCSIDEPVAELAALGLLGEVVR